MPYRPRDPETGRVLGAIAEAMVSIGLIIGLPYPFPLPWAGEPRTALVPARRPVERLR